VYRIAATPEPPSAAESETDTEPPYHPLEQTERLQAIEDVGASVSGTV
jgi:hypothetical protein